MDAAKRNELRQFGLLTGSLIAILLGWFFPWMRGHSYRAWACVTGGVLVISGLLYPPVLKYPYAAWVALGDFLGWINSRVILTALYFIVVTPLGMVSRMLGRDSMTRKYDPEAQSYRIISRPRPIDSLERPF
jgi:hypothetical protein